MAEPLSLTGKRWILPSEEADYDVHKLADELLATRGLNAPYIAGTYDDMDTAVRRIHAAVEKKEVVGIFGDYDCDGITAVAQLVRFFRRRDMEPVIRLPHRVHDGYGLQTENSTWFAQKNVTLLITVDTGIASVDAIEEATKQGMDVIVTDHHKPHAEIPSAFAILHPQLSNAYPEPHPSGAGVAYELLTALENNEWEEKNVDLALAMIGTVADLVPLRGVNRQLVQEGLRSLEQLTNCPLADLRDHTGAFTSTDIAFRIAPRINAAGRMSDPSIALSAILEGGEALAILDDLNEQRQAWMQELYSDAVQSIPEPATQSLLWTASTAYPHGIIGLIAGKLTEHYGKPSCVVTVEGDTCTASLRSPACYHITDGLSRCSHLLTSFGGHAQAAGCSFSTKNTDALQKALEEDVQQQTTPDDLQPFLQIDAVLEPSDIRLSLLDSLSALEPYGQGNTEPRFLVRNVHLDDVRLVGSEQSHLQCRIHNCKAIGFGLGTLESYCNEPMDVICRISIDAWDGRKRPQLIVEDVRSTQVRDSLPSETPA